MNPRERLEALEQVFAALGHASRRQILLTVHIRGGMSAGDIAKRFEHAWPTISRHLRVLEDARLWRGGMDLVEAQVGAQDRDRLGGVAWRLEGFETHSAEFDARL